ncbi:3'-5' exonuclease [Litchfieldella xinjiangensis]|uniref:3'-5' exonuclease n=1 Tax=Litchfieldella xinjiangensis TaxID=1166948 RepID=UPI0005B911B5|nr:3'-5' exonuclease [Halomonas xinjiangensis]
MLSFRLATPQQPSWDDYFAHRAETTRDGRLARFYGEGSLHPDTPIGEAPLVALDLETTGLDARRHDIVSVGIVPFTLDRIALPKRRYWVVRPRRPLEAASVAFHRITHDEIADAPRFEAILETLLEQLAGRLVVVHFRHIERPFLNAAVHEAVGEEFKFPMIDTMSIEAQRYRQTAWARLRRWLGRPSVSIRLHNSRARYGLPGYQGHHALVDALATAELFQAQVARHYSPQAPVSTFWR